MAEQMLDFWPDIAEAKPKVTPLLLMKQQAALLGKHTGNLLEGKVSTQALKEGDLLHTFSIAAPTMGYTYDLFIVQHSMVKLYPVEVISAPKVNVPTKSELGSEEEFLHWLKAVLNSDRTKRVLGSLLAQVEA